MARRRCRPVWTLALALWLLPPPVAAQTDNTDNTDKRMPRPSSMQPSSRRCQAAALPALLPSVAQLADSATISALFRRDSLVAGDAVFRVHFGAAGAMNGFGMLESDLPPAAQRQVAVIIANLIHAQPVGRPYGLRLAVVLGWPAKLTVLRSEYCRPVFGPSEPESVMMQFDAGMRFVRRTPRWEVSITVDGRVVGLQILDPTGYPDLEATTREHLLRSAFLPALLDGKPMAVVDTIPVEVSGYAR